MTQQHTKIMQQHTKVTQQHTCRRCGVLVSHNEIGMTKKLINRGAEVFYCLDCLAGAFEVSREDLEKKIREFKESGCTLFS